AGEARSVCRLRDTTQRMPGVRGRYQALSFIPIQGHGVSSDLRRPEGLVELLAQSCSAGIQLARALHIPEKSRYRDTVAQCLVRPGLYFAQGDEALHGRPVGVKNRIGRIAPPLVQETTRRRAVFDEPVAVTIPKVGYPAKRRIDMRPQVPDQAHIAGCLEVAAGEDDVERRCIAGAVVPVK